MLSGQFSWVNFWFLYEETEDKFKTKSKALNHVLKHLFMVTIINA